MSSTSAGRSPGTRSIALHIAAAARSSGRVAESFPFGALPTAVRTAETITGEVIVVFQTKGADYGGVKKLVNLGFGHIPLLCKEGNRARFQFIRTSTTL